MKECVREKDREFLCVGEGRGREGEKFRVLPHSLSARASIIRRECGRVCVSEREGSV